MTILSLRNAFAAVTLAASVWAAGCTALAIGAAAAAAAVGTYVYTEGRLESVEEAPLDKVYNATVQAMKDMQFEMKEERKDALEARVVALRADKTEIKIAMESKSDTTTEVRIRVGVFGDEKDSAEILQRIRDNF